MPSSKLLCLALVVAALALSATFAWSVGTPEGTRIFNWSMVTYTNVHGASPDTAYSDTVLVRVAFQCNLVVLPIPPADTQRITACANGNTYYFLHILRNLGNGVDTIGLSSVANRTWTIRYFQVMDSTRAAALNYNAGLGDSVITGARIRIPMDGSVYVLLGVTIPADTAAINRNDTIAFTATSVRSGVCTATRYDIAKVVGPILNFSLTSTSAPAHVGGVAPGDIITYHMTVANRGTSRASALKIVVGVPDSADFVLASTGAFPGGTFRFKTNPNPWSAVPAANADSVEVTFAPATLDSNATDSTRFNVLLKDCQPDLFVTNAAQLFYSDSCGSAMPVMVDRDTLNVIPLSVDLYAPYDTTINMGDTLFLTHYVWNSSTILDSFQLNAANRGTPSWNYSFWPDLNGNGLLDVSDTAGRAAQDTLIVAAGVRRAFFLRVLTGATYTNPEIVRLLAFSRTDSCTNDTLRDTLTVVAPNLTVVQSESLNFAGATWHSRFPGDSILALPKQFVTFRFLVTNIGTGAADSLVFIQTIPHDSLDMAAIPMGGPDGVIADGSVSINTITYLDATGTPIPAVWVPTTPAGEMICPTCRGIRVITNNAVHLGAGQNGNIYIRMKLR